MDAFSVSMATVWHDLKMGKDTRVQDRGTMFPVVMSATAGFSTPSWSCSRPLRKRSSRIAGSCWATSAASRWWTASRAKRPRRPPSLRRCPFMQGVATSIDVAFRRPLPSRVRLMALAASIIAVVTFLCMTGPEHRQEPLAPSSGKNIHPGRRHPHRHRSGIHLRGVPPHSCAAKLPHVSFVQPPFLYNNLTLPS